jgi:16S rRNA (adenine1518-N6/adenine1519-N6)-dimethyltransferase
MDASYYKGIINGFGASKRLGQSFLIDTTVARAEAVHGAGKKVLEMGPGLGILTAELSKVAKSVVAIEVDPRAYRFLMSVAGMPNVRIINSDFFRFDFSSIPRQDIMISNIPYSLSSKVIGWLASHRMHGVLCLQREFVEHMLARPGTESYSKLSVFSSLQFSLSYIMDVQPRCFYPEPRVSSSVIYLKPKGRKVSRAEKEMLSLIMEHKKKKLRNAIIDSEKALSITHEGAMRIADLVEHSNERPFMLPPEALLSAAKSLIKLLK